MDCEFSIPINKEDLLTANGDDYRVKEVQEPSSLSDSLEECSIEFRNEGPTALTHCFDTYYSVLHHLSRLKSEIKATSWTHILKNSEVHFNSLPMIIDPEGIEPQTRVMHLSTLKMEVYLMIQFMEAFENDTMKPDANIVPAKKGKAKKKNVEESWDWSNERTKGLSAISQMIQLDIQRLWDPPIVEDEFTNLVSGVCYKCLENQQIIRQKEDKDIVFQILGQLIKKCNHQLARQPMLAYALCKFCTFIVDKSSACKAEDNSSDSVIGKSASLRIIQLVQHYEHLVSAMAHACAIFVNDFGCKNIIGDILREIGRMDGNELSRDTSGTRSFSQFIVELTNKIPAYVLPNISLLSSHLDGDSYSMRNGVLGVFAEIVIKVLSKENLDDNMKKSRESFLDKLEDHIHDVHAFVRSKVIQLWLQMAQEKAIPLSRQSRVVDLIIGRLRDKSNQVRKYAIQFLKASLIGNPFAAKLSLEQLSTSLEKETEKLKEMDPDSQEASPVDATQPSEEWKSIENVLKEAILKYFEDNNMEQDQNEVHLYEDDDDAIEKVLRRIQNHLKENEYKDAITLLQASVQMWKDAEEFQLAEEEENVKEFEESNKNEEDAKNDEDVDSTPNLEKIQKQRAKTKMFILLRKIYHAQLSASPMEIDLASATQEGTKEKEKTVIECNELEKQKVLVNYLKDCVQFAQQMRRAVPVLCQMLRSKVASDKLETIDYFIAAHEFGVAQSEEGIRRMANLIWSRDPVVKKAVVGAFERLYIDVAVDNGRNKATAIVKGLMSLITEANLGELTSLEELVCELMKMELIPQSVVQLLWQTFTLKLPQISYEEQRLSIIILSMIAGAEKEIIKSNLSLLVEHGLICKKNDLSVARDTCSAILKLTTKQKSFASSSTEPFRLPADHLLFIRLENLLIDQFTILEADYWTPFSESAIAIIYNLSEFPDRICGRILRKLLKNLMETHSTTEELQKGTHYVMGIKELRTPILKNICEQLLLKMPFSDKENYQALENDLEDAKDKEPSLPNGDEDIFPTGPEEIVNAPAPLLARLLSLAGHVALLQLYHLDVNIFAELKRRHRIREEEKEKQGQKSKKTPKRQSVKDNTASSVSSKQEAGLDEEMGVGGAAAEDAEAEYIRKICERDIVTGDNLLALFPPAAILICSNPSKYKHEELQKSATLALFKFMIMSSEFCDANLQLLFTILEKSEHPTIRSNTIIALGDLTFRFPNLIEPWTPHLYARLRDDSVDVRKTAITILTHLILNDMIKVKGQISEMAICLEDKEEKIAGAAKLLFSELAQKGNALYNVTPDIISRLSDPDTGVDEKTFRTILRFLLSFIQKDKQAESLVEKLCHRFRATRTERQWHDLSFCLSVLPYNEKGFKKLMENIGCYQDKLADEEVFNCFTIIITKSKKFAKPELRTLVDEFEVTLQGYHTKGADENAEFAKASKALSVAVSQANTRKTDDTNKQKKKGTVRQKKSKLWKGESDGESDDAASGKENKKPLPGKGKRKQNVRTRKTVLLNQVFSSDDEDIFE